MAKTRKQRINHDEDPQQRKERKASQAVTPRARHLENATQPSRVPKKGTRPVLLASADRLANASPTPRTVGGTYWRGGKEREEKGGAEEGGHKREERGARRVTPKGLE